MWDAHVLVACFDQAQQPETEILRYAQNDDRLFLATLERLRNHTISSLP